jgi:hypothetical protein
VKKLISVMLGLSLTMGSAALVFGQDKQAPTKQDSKDKGDKKAKADADKDKQAPTKQDSKDKGDKGKDKK